MIPIKLALRNFMCYRDSVPPLRFEGFHVACLCGDNGNGKSALLDAVTWALWGKARARSDDDLIYLDESEMEVDFEFVVGSNRYRVIRKRSKGGLKRAGQSVLELQVATSEEGFLAITGNTIAETQRRISDILRMDYQTFINSALLLQGRADEFSMKRPGERKEVLANILALSLYDDLEKLARDRRKEMEMQHRNIGDGLARIERQLEQKQQYEDELEEVQKAISRLGAEMEKQEASLTSLRQSKDALLSRKQQYEEINSLVEGATQQMEYLDARARDHRARIDRYGRVLSGQEAERTATQSKLGELAEREHELVEMRASIEQLSNRTHYLTSANQQLKKQMEELRGKIDQLEQAEAECPLCGTELGEQGRQRIMASYEAEGQEKADTYRANLSELKQKDSELNRLRGEVGKLESAIAAERSRCERRADSLARDLAEAEENLPQEQDALAQAVKAIGDLAAALQENIEKRAAVELEMLALPRLEEECNLAEAAYRDIRERERRSRDRLVEVQATLQRCAELEADKQQNLAALRLAGEERGIYDELAGAFSKNGIQAMIIETVLPELEEVANLLLSRMTDNRMHLKIESQRDTKKGDTIETLDIRISDELGTRNYEMFSGGEAFRVNFALRIALSKLLARRAGAPLPTLFIDEGFGTQDSTGREKLVEAINSIQDDFEKILVITHIEELKDAFPVRIEVTKTDEGATFALT
jgi:exonuclease SbcC